MRAACLLCWLLSRVWRIQCFDFSDLDLLLRDTAEGFWERCAGFCLSSAYDAQGLDFNFVILTIGMVWEVATESDEQLCMLKQIDECEFFPIYFSNLPMLLKFLPRIPSWLLVALFRCKHSLPEDFVFLGQVFLAQNLGSRRVFFAVKCVTSGQGKSWTLNNARNSFRATSEQPWRCSFSTID